MFTEDCKRLSWKKFLFFFFFFFQDATSCTGRGICCYEHWLYTLFRVLSHSLHHFVNRTSAHSWPVRELGRLCPFISEKLLENLIQRKTIHSNNYFVPLKNKCPDELRHEPQKREQRENKSVTHQCVFAL